MRLLWRKCERLSQNRFNHGLPAFAEATARQALITRMVYEEMLPTKHTKHTNESESAS
jgi:hypothetical protein